MKAPVKSCVNTYMWSHFTVPVQREPRQLQCFQRLSNLAASHSEDKAHVLHLSSLLRAQGNVNKIKGNWEKHLHCIQYSLRGDGEQVPCDTPVMVLDAQLGDVGMLWPAGQGNISAHTEYNRTELC